MTRLSITLILLLSFLGLSAVYAEDPYHYFTWHVSYGTISPLGKPQKAIMINKEFPGPVINCSSNNNIVVNVFNDLDEPLLFTWNGIQHRKNSWMDGMPGTNCPIQPGKNWTYHWQAKDQIGTYFYFPSTGMQKAAGGFGPMRVHSRDLIPVPYFPAAEEFDVLIHDWYFESHKEIQKTLDAGRLLTRPDGVLINGKSGNEDNVKPMFNVEAGKTYIFRVCNVGLKASLNFRMQSHKMKLVEMEGSHTVQNTYDSIDVHVGQCFTVMVEADQEESDYYIVASTRFLKEVERATAILRYKGSKGKPSSSVLPGAPVGWEWSLNQWRSFRWNLTASAARPNPQGSYHYGQINITRTIKLVNSRIMVDGKARYALNGISHTDPTTPVKLAEYFNASTKVFEYNLLSDEPPKGVKAGKIAPSVVSAEFRTFIEIVFENPEKSLQVYHLDGYSFFPAGMGPGKWTPASRKTYNNLDTVSRHTVQVYQNSWTAILLTFDNAGMWNLRSAAWDRHYLGQQLYISVVSPARSLRDEYNMPEISMRCGKVVGLPQPPSYAPA
ncbi:L-ascorbate oxidase [Rhynchospora pubera]|uniref:L-ascorbate oxidase n=1 Tax=Rhynchospora pubera TaxID=906938 RepID=A0AAV8DI89_9POAL|nr:L-ascorbate oxidase [Rhynchospora pubera]KAJ4821676.1 L-ascorbate oxidase [Rhynchospora pubera]